MKFIKAFFIVILTLALYVYGIYVATTFHMYTRSIFICTGSALILMLYFSLTVGVQKSNNKEVKP